VELDLKQSKPVQAGLANQSVNAGGTPADFARQIKAYFDPWEPIVKQSGFTPARLGAARAS
jgi:hypothetical protein